MLVFACNKINICTDRQDSITVRRKTREAFAKWIIHINENSFVNTAYYILAIQIIRPSKNIHPGPQQHDISTLYEVPAGVKTVLMKACCDCHSNKTLYPWYSNIQPVAWWLNDHINTGKREINFNEFAGYPLHIQYRTLKVVKGQVSKNEMPLSSYTLIHKNALLIKMEKDDLLNWTDTIPHKMESTYPADSLKKVED